MIALVELLLAISAWLACAPTHYLSGLCPISPWLAMVGTLLSIGLGFSSRPDRVHLQGLSGRVAIGAASLPVVYDVRLALNSSHSTGPWVSNYDVFAYCLPSILLLVVTTVRFREGDPRANPAGRPMTLFLIGLIAETLCHSYEEGVWSRIFPRYAHSLAEMTAAVRALAFAAALWVSWGSVVVVVLRTLKSVVVRGKEWEGSGQ